MTIIINGLELLPGRRRVKVDELFGSGISLGVLQGQPIEVPKDTRSICVLQSESCTVPWSHGGVVGSQDATTCVIVFVLCGYGVTVLHFDEGTSASNEYLSKTLTGIQPSEKDVQLHMIGGYDDEKDTGQVVLENLLSFFNSQPICFNLVTSAVGKLNTKVVDDGHNRKYTSPIYDGASVCLSTRRLSPAKFLDR